MPLAHIMSKRAIVLIFYISTPITDMMPGTCFRTGGRRVNDPCSPIMSSCNYYISSLYFPRIKQIGILCISFFSTRRFYCPLRLPALFTVCHCRRNHGQQHRQRHQQCCDPFRVFPHPFSSLPFRSFFPRFSNHRSGTPYSYPLTISITQKSCLYIISGTEKQKRT